MLNFEGNELVGILMFLLFVGALIAIIVMAFQLAGLKRVLDHGAGYLARPCPFCRERIAREASVCKHCGRESPPWQLAEDRWWTKGPDGADLWLDETTNTWRLTPQARSDG